MAKTDDLPVLDPMDKLAANLTAVILKNAMNGLLLEFRGRVSTEKMCMIFTSETARIMGGVAAENEITVQKIRHNFRVQFRESMDSIPVQVPAPAAKEQKTPPVVSKDEPIPAA